MDNGLGNAGAFFMVRRGNGWHRSSPCFVFGCARHWAAPRQRLSKLGFCSRLAPMACFICSRVLQKWHDVGSRHNDF